MTLSDGWVALTCVSIIVGFFMGRRDGLDVYNRQFPPPPQWAVPPHLQSRDEPAQVRPLTATPYWRFWLPMWGFWVFGGQVIYWGISLVQAAKGSNPGTLLMGVMSYLVWAVPICAALVATGLVVLRFVRQRMTASDDEQPELVPVLDPPPVVHPAQQETQVMWSAPTYEGKWDRP